MAPWRPGRCRTERFLTVRQQCRRDRLCTSKRDFWCVSDYGAKKGRCRSGKPRAPVLGVLRAKDHSSNEGPIPVGLHDFRAMEVGTHLQLPRTTRELTRNDLAVGSHGMHAFPNDPWSNRRLVDCRVTRPVERLPVPAKTPGRPQALRPGRGQRVGQLVHEPDTCEYNGPEQARRAAGSRRSGSSGPCSRHGLSRPCSMGLGARWLGRDDGQGLIHLQGVARRKPET